jgi:hypothetical protein
VFFFVASRVFSHVSEIRLDNDDDDNRFCCCSRYVGNVDDVCSARTRADDVVDDLKKNERKRVNLLLGGVAVCFIHDFVRDDVDEESLDSLLVLLVVVLDVVALVVLVLANAIAVDVAA